ncbi:hypothetical protein B0A49_00568 [Cryomyces minteri]|uniref:NAD(P)-binding protein n=1 Tax=Cryomyces minteri TaxID=331657 RepID=A0A4U0XQI4_9PEZI|nr:hypothetical protein B0A49_00568 [Cryomyces minteri]
MSQRLQNRTAIVTGASSGLGRAISVLYAREGANVVCADLSPNVGGTHTKDELSGNEGGDTPTHELIEQQVGKGRATFVKVDVCDESSIEAMVAAAVEKYGRLDIIVNNAGITGVTKENEEAFVNGAGFRLHETSTESFDLTIRINTRGLFLGCKHAIKQMLKQEPLEANSRGDRTRGWIVNTASMLGLVAFPGAPAYVTSKHGAVGLTKQIAIDYAKDRIHCNALCPGFVDTPMISKIIAGPMGHPLTAAHPWQTLGKPEDVARVALFLVSEDAQWVTGVPMVIDGGVAETEGEEEDVGISTAQGSSCAGRKEQNVGDVGAFAREMGS